MASLAVPLVIVLLIAAAALHGMGKRVLGCWLLALFPASLCVAILYDLSRGAARIGTGALAGDRKQLVYVLVLLVLSVFAALRPKWPWLFWIAWAPSGFICGILVYLAFFWKVFN